MCHGSLGPQAIPAPTKGCHSSWLTCPCDATCRRAPWGKIEIPEATGMSTRPSSHVTTPSWVRSRLASTGSRSHSLLSLAYPVPGRDATTSIPTPTNIGNAGELAGARFRSRAFTGVLTLRCNTRSSNSHARMDARLERGAFDRERRRTLGCCHGVTGKPSIDVYSAVFRQFPNGLERKD